MNTHSISPSKSGIRLIKGSANEQFLTVEMKSILENNKSPIWEAWPQLRDYCRLLSRNNFDEGEGAAKNRFVLWVVVNVRSVRGGEVVVWDSATWRVMNSGL